jgi:zinc protease
MPFSPPTPATFTLGNGARVIVIENHRLPLVAMESLHLGAGSREDGDKSGLAALTADMLDEGAGSFSSETLPEQLERLGATLDIATGADFSSISLTAMSFDSVASLLGDLIVKPRFTPTDFERVKTDRLEALAQRQDRPRAIASLVFSRIVFGQHPYASPTDGTKASVSSLKLDAVTTFWKTAYQPSSTVFIVAGDVTATQVQQQLEKVFGGWNVSAAAKNATTTTVDRKPPVAGPGRPMIALVERPDAPQSVVLIGRRSMAAGDERFFTSEVVNTAIGGSFASRLNQKLREELGYTYGIGSAFWRGRWGGTWTVSSSIRSDVTMDGIEQALAIIKDLRTAALPAAEWRKAQDLIVRGLPQEFETNAGIVSAFHRLVLAGAPTDSYPTWAPRITAATAAQGQTLASTAWNDVSIVIVGDGKILQASMERLGKLGLPIVKFNADGTPQSPLPGLDGK